MAALTIKPEEEKRVKGLGFLSNKGTDNFSGRIITRNGKITAAEMACIAQAAEKFGHGIVVFTTRGDPLRRSRSSAPLSQRRA